MEQSHPATNKEVRNWGLAQLGTLLAIASPVLVGSWFVFKLGVGQALAQDGGYVTPEELATVKLQVATVQAEVRTMDAGLQLKLEANRAEQKADTQRVEKKVDRLIELMLKKEK